jgi:hypothetical protein
MYNGGCFPTLGWLCPTPFPFPPHRSPFCLDTKGTKKSRQRRKWPDDDGDGVASLKESELARSARSNNDSFSSLCSPCASARYGCLSVHLGISSTRPYSSRPMPNPHTPGTGEKSTIDILQFSMPARRSSVVCGACSMAPSGPSAGTDDGWQGPSSRPNRSPHHS